MKSESKQTIPTPLPVDPKPVPYTLRIGVIGHRDLINPQGIAVATEKLLKKIEQSLIEGMIDPHQPQTARQTKWQCFESHLIWKIKRGLAFVKILPKETDSLRRTPLHFNVISSLAKGADRILARIAIEKYNASLKAILPFDVDNYRKDFDLPYDLNEFNELFEKAENKLDVFQGSFPSSVSQEEGYERAGKEVVDSCEILLAVWDGKPSRGKGGTAEIVEYACSVNRLVVWINAIDPDLPVLIVRNYEKLKTENDLNTNQDCTVITRPLPRIAAAWSSRFVQVAEYNRDMAFRNNGFERIFNDHWVNLETKRAKADLPPKYLHPLLNFILPDFAKADYLALIYQKIHIRSATWLYRLAAIAVAIAVLQTLYAPDQTGWILLEILALVGAVVWFRLSFIENWHEKWLNYRHLSERLRILTFNSLIGNKSTANGSTQHERLPFYPGPGGWVLEVFDKIKQDLPIVIIPETDIIKVRQFIIDGWIADQAEFHKKNAIKKEYCALQDHKLIGFMLAITLIAAMLHLLKLFHYPLIENFIIALVIILPAFATAQHAIGSIHDFERIATRSARMKEILNHLERSIYKTTTIDALKREIQRAEEIMSTENHEWCVSLSFRRISLPV